MRAGAPRKAFVSDLRPWRTATVEGAVSKLEPTREVEQRVGGTTRGRNGVLKDGTGEAFCGPRGRETDLVSEGDQVRIADGEGKDYRGRIQISLGRSGK